MNKPGKSTQTSRKNLQCGKRLSITQGNIIYQSVEAIVNPTDNSLRGHGLSSQIYQAAGEAIIKATRQIEWLETSEAKITKGYKLIASYIIHTCAPVWDKTNSKISSKQLARCYRNCLQLAAQNQIHSLAFPCISTGMRGFPRDWAAKIALTEALTFLENHPLPWRIIFVCHELDNYEQYKINLPTSITSPTSRQKYESKIARQLLTQIQSEYRVAIIGSTSFWGVTTKAICNATGRKLATSFQKLALLTGGVTGIPEAVSRSFWQECYQQHQPALVYHIQPEGFQPWEYGLNLYGGKTLFERREILARMASVYVLIEGGPGAKQEAETAIEMGAVVIPVGVTGGYAKRLYEQMPRPYYISSKLWQKLGEENISSETLGEAIAEIIEKVWQRPRDVIFDPKKKLVTDIELHSALGVNYKKLQDLLAASQWQKADRETFRLLCEIAFRIDIYEGIREAKEVLKTINKNIQSEIFNQLTRLLQNYQKMLESIHREEFPASSFYGHFSSCLNEKFVYKLPLLDFRTIDLLWIVYSHGHFGFSVQERIWRTLSTQSEDLAKVEKNFINCVGRGYAQTADAYHENKVNFSLQSPEGLLPWLNWYDVQGTLRGIESNNKLIYLISKLSEIGMFNKLWRQQIRERLDAGNNDFSNCVLIGLSLQDLNFQDANLRAADLQNANCERGNFTNADLRGANLTGAKFSVGALQEAVLDSSEVIYNIKSG
ncbi:macro domain-containing protein [Okeania sp.]|uniref:macro domain-containing protein n=1 Tax=Okeania sp. TaxID=3100323 RepID=UPI002B4ACDFC|nr:macro domain-containing protein [Okeania sp.]MEB3343406.1 macro domain-containing protein [Okeania sp.]